MTNSLTSLGTLLKPGAKRMKKLLARTHETGVEGMKWGVHVTRNLGGVDHHTISPRTFSSEKDAKTHASDLSKRGVKAKPFPMDGEATAQDYGAKKESRHRESVVIKFTDLPERVRKIRESYRKNFLEQSADEPGKKKGRVYLVTIIEEGLGNSKDRNYYSAEAMESGIATFDGAKAYADHPDAITEKTLPERSMKDLVGWYSDCFTDKNPSTGKTRLRGKLHFFPSANWLTTMIDTILTDPTAKGLFGISINAVGKTRPGEMDGQSVNYVEEFQRVDSADVVTEPAARGKFDKMLESKRSVTGDHNRKVSNKRRAREAAILSPEQTKAVADSLVSAYNSDSFDEVKQTVFDAAKVLNGSVSASVGEDDSSSKNGEQQKSGGSKDMPTKVKKMKTSVGKRTVRKGKTLRAAGAGQESEVEESEEEEIPKRRTHEAEESEESEESDDVEESEESNEDDVEESEEADVEDGDFPTDNGSLGDLEDLGDGGHYQRSSKEAKNRREGPLAKAQRESEEADSAETRERGDVRVSGTKGGLPGADFVAADEAEEDDSDVGDDDVEGDDDMDAQESEEAEAVPTGRRRQRRAGREGEYGTSGKAMLPKTTFDRGNNVGYTGDRTDDALGEPAESTSGGVGLSYKLKTSRFARNAATRKVVAPVVREANRRIESLIGLATRLRESRNLKDRKLDRVVGILKFKESQTRAFALLRVAVKDEIIPESVAASMAPRLFGLREREQKQEIIESARLLESATEGAVSRMTESVEGAGARGGVAFRYGTAEADTSELIEGFANSGIPMKKRE